MWLKSLWLKIISGAHISFFLIFYANNLFSIDSFFASFSAAKELGSNRSSLTYTDKSNVFDLSTNSNLKDFIDLEKQVMFTDSGNIAFTTSIGYSITNNIRADTEIVIEIKETVAGENKENFTSGGYIESWLVNLTYLTPSLAKSFTAQPFLSLGLGIGLTKINGDFNFEHIYEESLVMHPGNYADSLTTGLGLSMKAGIEFSLLKSTLARLNYAYRGLFHVSGQGKIISAAAPYLDKDNNLFFSIDKNNLKIIGGQNGGHYIDIGFIMAL